MVLGSCGVANATPSFASVISNPGGETIGRQYVVGSFGGALSLTFSVTGSNPRMCSRPTNQNKIKGGHA